MGQDVYIEEGGDEKGLQNLSLEVQKENTTREIRVYVGGYREEAYIYVFLGTGKN
jgi:hypothetical protein